MNKKALFLSFTFLAFGLASCNKVETISRGQPRLDKAVWIWTENETGYSAQVKIPYSTNDYEIVDAKVTKEIGKERSCTESGIDRYVAKATYYGVLLESKKDVSVPAKGHSYDDFYITETAHYAKCECGALQEPHSHTYGNEIVVEQSDGWKNPGTAKKICNVCKYEKVYNLLSQEEYTNLKLDHLTQLLNSVTGTPVISEIYKYTNVINDIKEVFDLLDYDEINKLNNTNRSKLLSLLFDFETVLDSRVNNSYSLYSHVASITDVATMTYGVKDSVYGDVCELYLNEDWDNINYSTSYDNPYPNLIINNTPSVTTDTKSLVLFIYAPETNVEVNFKYFGFNTSNVDRANLLSSNIALNKGWNTIQISGSALGILLSKNVQKLRLDFISSSGLKKTVNNETWKISSMYASNEPIGNMVAKISNLPGVEQARSFDYLNVRGLLNKFEKLPPVCKKILDNNGKIKALYTSVSKYVDLPYGDTYDIKINWNTSHVVTPSVDTAEFGPAYKIDVAFDVTNGSYQHAIGATYKTSKQTAVFYTKNYDGEMGVEYQGPGDGTYGKFCELQRVPLANGCYAHYIKIDDYAKFDNLVLTNCESKLCVKLRGTVRASQSVYLSPILHVNIRSVDVDDALALLPDVTPTSLSVAQKATLDGVKFLYDATTEKSEVSNLAKLNAYFDKFYTK